MIARWILDDKHERQVRVFMVFNVWEWNALQMFSDLTHHFFFAVILQRRCNSNLIYDIYAVTLPTGFQKQLWSRFRQTERNERTGKGRDPSWRRHTCINLVYPG